MFVKIERLLQILSRRIPCFRAISNENSEIHDGSKYNCKRKLFLLLPRITAYPSALSSFMLNLPDERIILVALESRRSAKVGPAAIPERLLGPNTR